MSNKMKKICITLVALLGLIELGQCAQSYNEAMKYCAERAGLKLVDISEFKMRNEKCSIDCITRLGTVLAYQMHEGENCSNVPLFRCSMGKCRSAAERVNTDDLYDIQVYIKSALVPDMDSSPLAGGSDTFVSVEVERNGQPSYADNEIICHTYVVQDTNQPRWSRFVCRPMPIGPNTVLKFSLFDSDKPAEQHDFLGAASESVEYLLSKGTINLPLVKNEVESSRYYIQVEVKGSKYEPFGASQTAPFE